MLTYEELIKTEEYKVTRAAAEYYNKHPHANSMDTFEAAVKWYKEQLMKDAVSCQVVGEQRDLRLINSTERCLFDARRGDWLKIIIIKEDGK